MQKLLITGASGVIGKILFENLQNEFSVYGLDIKKPKISRVFQVDIAKMEELTAIFKKLENVSCVIHLAANPHWKAEWKSVLPNNIIGTRNVYECCRQYEVTKVIFASSSHVTGGYLGITPSIKKMETKAISVRDPIRPDGYYGTSKAFGEALARQYFELYGISSICLRIGFVPKDNDPAKGELLMKMWLSHRDLVQLIRKSIYTDVKFGIYYGVSDNSGRFLCIENAKRELGYKPQDNSALLKGD